MAEPDKDVTASDRGPTSGGRRTRRSRGDGTRKPGRHPAARAMRSAAGQLEELLGHTPESVTSVRPTEDGWEADVEVLELERVPETTSVMGTYHVTLDEEGDLLAYERTRRYTRGQIDQRR